MSGRVRKQSDCPVGKQGPMRATLPVSSVMKQGGSLKRNQGNSPTLSPTNIWRRISPDHALSGQRSPGAVNYKGETYYCNNLKLYFYKSETKLHIMKTLICHLICLQKSKSVIFKL